LIGNSLGARTPEKGKRYFKIISVMATCGGALISILAYLNRALLASELTTNEELKEVVEETYKIFLFFLVVDCTQGWLGGVVRGLNLHSKGTVICFIVYYPIALTLASLFSFVGGMGAYGLWLGVFFA